MIPYKVYMMVDTTYAQTPNPQKHMDDYRYKHVDTNTYTYTYTQISKLHL